MESILLIITLSALAVVLVIWKLLDHFIFRHHKTTNVLKALLIHFRDRDERAVEFRIVESKAKQTTKEFEVKTIRQKYYTVVIKGLKVLSSEPIDGFSITEENSYMRGVIDPVRMNGFEIFVREPNL